MNTDFDCLPFELLNIICQFVEIKENFTFNRKSLTVMLKTVTTKDFIDNRISLTWTKFFNLDSRFKNHYFGSWKHVIYVKNLTQEIRRLSPYILIDKENTNLLPIYPICGIKAKKAVYEIYYGNTDADQLDLPYLNIEPHLPLLCDTKAKYDALSYIPAQCESYMRKFFDSDETKIFEFSEHTDKYIGYLHRNFSEKFYNEFKLQLEEIPAHEWANYYLHNLVTDDIEMGENMIYSFFYTDIEKVIQLNVNKDMISVLFDNYQALHLAIIHGISISISAKSINLLNKIKFTVINNNTIQLYNRLYKVIFIDDTPKVYFIKFNSYLTVLQCYRKFDKVEMAEWCKLNAKLIIKELYEDLIKANPRFPQKQLPAWIITALNMPLKLRYFYDLTIPLNLIYSLKTPITVSPSYVETAVCENGTPIKKRKLN